jgi:quercetin dioxygenase-like cupin family protein
MKISDIPFVTTDWASVPTERHAGDAGEALWRVQYFGPEENRIRVRMVEYSPGYVADHWCSKGHIILCLDGEMETTLADGRVLPLKAGMTYQVADGAEAHRSRTETGAKLFIVD